MRGLVNDINKYSQAHGRRTWPEFPTESPTSSKSFGKPWGALVDLRIRDPKLKGIISSLWVITAFRRRRSATYYYAMPTIAFSRGGLLSRGEIPEDQRRVREFISARGGESSSGRSRGDPDQGPGRLWSGDGRREEYTAGSSSRTPRLRHLPQDDRVPRPSGLPAADGQVQPSLSSSRCSWGSSRPSRDRRQGQEVFLQFGYTSRRITRPASKARSAEATRRPCTITSTRDIA